MSLQSTIMLDTVVTPTDKTLHLPDFPKVSTFAMYANLPAHRKERMPLAIADLNLIRVTVGVPTHNTHQVIMTWLEGQIAGAKQWNDTPNVQPTLFLDFEAPTKLKSGAVIYPAPSDQLAVELALAVEAAGFQVGLYYPHIASHPEFLSPLQAIR